MDVAGIGNLVIHQRDQFSRAEEGEVGELGRELRGQIWGAASSLSVSVKEKMPWTSGSGNDHKELLERPGSEAFPAPSSISHPKENGLLC